MHRLLFRRPFSTSAKLLKELKSAKEFEELLSGSKPVLVDFYATWCGPCKIIGPLLEKTLKDEKYANKVEFAKVNSDEFGALAEDNRVYTLPTIILMDNKKEIDRFSGAQSETFIRNWIDKSLKEIK